MRQVAYVSGRTALAGQRVAGRREGLSQSPVRRAVAQ
jgi:hypothetical protein